MEVEVAGCKKIFFARGRWCRRHYLWVEFEVAGCKKIFLPGGGGAGGIIRGWGESGVEVAGCKTIFPIGHFFLIFNLKILPI